MLSRSTLARFASFTFAAALGLGSLGCGTRGSGIAGSEERKPEDFNTIEIHGAYALRVHVGADTRKLEVRGDDNLIEAIHTDVSEGRLSIGSEDRLRPDLVLEIEVWVPQLDRLIATDDTEVEIEGLSGRWFELELSDAKAELRGALVRFAVSVEQGAEVDARGLVAENVVVNMDSAATAKVTATQGSEIVVADGGKVEVWGGAAPNSEVISGSGTIVRH